MKGDADFIMGLQIISALLSSVVLIKELERLMFTV